MNQVQSTALHVPSGVGKLITGGISKASGWAGFRSVYDDVSSCRRLSLVRGVGLAA